MRKNLVIVESPAKAKTIEKYLGADYTVKSSFGHIRDLPRKDLSIDKANGFMPTYEIPSDKKKVVSELRKASKEATTVWLASDEDREGEAIAWHLAQALKLDTKKTKRIVFHEITKPAILHAIENPRIIDQNLVDAQQARRVLDRLVGYELSPVLWKKVRAGLSAGRVQSVAVRLIVEREREIKEFAASSSYKITAMFATQDKSELPAELTTKLKKVEDARAFLEHCADETYTITDVQTKPGSRNPGAPFTTSSLQQEASRRLGFSVKQTMTLAQRLYENGFITYMRTDSTVLSGLAIAAAQEYITATFGSQYHKVRQFKTKNQSAQEAHEAIRPTEFTRAEAGADANQKKLYRLIWQRAVASQMAPAQTSKTEITISLAKKPEKFMAKGEILEFDGFMRVYGGTKDDVLLPAVKKGEVLDLNSMTALETFTRPSARYSEASLVKKLEELGIGRPSTYAPTISTIQDRGYIEKSDVEGSERDVTELSLKNGKVTEKTDKQITGADRNKLLPTHLAEMTTDFLTKHFASIVDYDFTAKAEENFDKIAAGSQGWQEMLGQFYKGFHPLIEQSAGISRQETSQARDLGSDPKSGKPIVARYGRYGPMLQRGETESEEKPQFAPLPEGTTLDTVTLGQALEMFKLPRTVGTTKDGDPILANIGRFGPYVQVGKTYVSIKGQDPLAISEAEAREAIETKLAQAASALIQDFGNGITIKKGQYGPYITDGKKNAKIPKDKDPAAITATEAAELIKAAPARRAKKFRRRAAK